MRVHSKPSSCGARGSTQLHVHHVHVCEAGASRAVIPAGLAPAWTPARLCSPEISHKHPNHAIKPQAGGGQCSGCHGVGVAGGKGAEPTHGAFIEHSATPSAGHRSQWSLEPEAIWVRGHGDAKTLEVTDRVTGLGGLCRPSLVRPGAQRALTWRPPAASNLVMSSVPHRAPRATNTVWFQRCEASRSCCSVAWSARAEGDPTWGG